MSSRICISAILLAAALGVGGCSLANNNGPSLSEIAAKANATHTNTEIPVTFSADESAAIIKAHSDLGQTTSHTLITALEDMENHLAQIFQDHDVVANGEVTGTVNGVEVFATNGVHRPQDLRELMNFNDGIRSVRFDHHLLTVNANAEATLPRALDYIRGLDPTVMRNYDISVAYPVNDTIRHHTITHQSPETNMTMEQAAQHFAAMASVRATGLEYAGITDVEVPFYDAARNIAQFDVICNAAMNRPSEHGTVDGKQLAEKYKESTGWQIRVTVRDNCVWKKDS